MKHLSIAAAVAGAALATAPLVATGQPASPAAGASPAAHAAASPGAMAPGGAMAPAAGNLQTGTVPTGPGVVSGAPVVGATPFPTPPPDTTAQTYVPENYVEVEFPGAPNWNAFVALEKTINEYSMTTTTHVAKGGRVEERLYHMAYRKPTFGFNAILSGPGSGQAAVWHGGNRVRGHNALGLKAVLPINDPKATDLAGKTIVAAYMPWIVNGFELAGGGKLYEQPGPTVGGEATTLVTMLPIDPKRDRDCTIEQLYLSNTTHLPMEHDCFAGSAHQEHEVFSDWKINPNLPDSTFII